MTKNAETDKKTPDLEQLQSLQIQAMATDTRLRDRTARDEGTCVLGAGIVVRDPKTYKHFVLVHAPFQGNVGSYRALKPVLAELRERYPQYDIDWYDGIVD